MVTKCAFHFSFFFLESIQNSAERKAKTSSQKSGIIVGFHDLSLRIRLVFCELKEIKLIYRFLEQSTRVLACCFINYFSLFISETKSLFDRSSVVDRKESLPPLPEIDSPPMSPKKQLRPIKTMDSYNSQEGRGVEELRALIKKVLQNNYQAFEEVRLAKLYQRI